MNTSSQQGLTLIGVLVATIIISLVGVSASQLLTRSERVAEVGATQFVAANLAREGLELVRVIRDTNWFQNEDRSEWISESMCGSFAYDAVRARGGDAPLSVDRAKLYIDGRTHEWRHDASGEDSGYERVIEVDCTEKDSEPPYVTVTSTVTWDVRGEGREVVLKEKLFNWLP